MTSIEVLKGSVSRDGLSVAWVDRALFGDEPMIVCITIYCFLVFNFEFLLSFEVLQKGCTFVTGSKRVLATLWQICYRVSEVIREKSLRGYWQLFQIAHICQRVADGL
jgi:hypothetical protein